MQQSIRLFHIDAFSAAPFGGNPAGVALLRSPIPDGTMRKIAAELNLSETAFVQPHPDHPAPGPGDDPFTCCHTFSLRWFTPTVEVPLCGHATLAAAAALFKGCGNPSPAVHFHTLSGVLTVAQQLPAAPAAPALAAAAAAAGAEFEMSLPLYPPSAQLPFTTDAQREAVVQACTGGLEVREVLFDPHHLRYLMIVLADGTTRQQLECVVPDFGAMQAAVGGDIMRGVIVTTQGVGSSSGAAGEGAPRYHFYSRFFCPWLGVSEDPVTGSAHSLLAPYWAGRTGLTALTARQCSPRGGDLRITLTTAPTAGPEEAGAGGEAAGRVLVAGPATIVFSATLNL